jgi:hypothetical protein
MNTTNKSGRRRFLTLWVGLPLASCLAVVTARSLIAQSAGPDVFRVEEDWQLVIVDADSNLNAPQVTCTISPAGMGTAYCAFDINYHTQPDYVPGGLQVHTWDPLDPMEFADSSHTAVMSASSDTVTWTQTMTLDPNAGTITFQVINGQSQTWGTFGGQKLGNRGRLVLSINTAMSNLDSYDPNVSLDNSGVSFGGNLVVSQTLMAVRYYDVNGNLISQITTPQVVHPQQ